ncbi:MAG: hypothetical protein WC775_02625 [Patescibacteria group bacterium]|jgi:hypothetical protein
MRKSKQRVAHKLFLLGTLATLFLFFYCAWFVSPYVSYGIRNGLLKVFLYPTTALVKNNQGVVTIVLRGTGTTVVQYDLNRKKIVLITSGKLFREINKSSGYHVIFSELHQNEAQRAASIITRLSDIRFILTREKYVEYVSYLDKSLQKNISLTELFALWRTYRLHKAQFTIVQQ